MNAIVGIQNDPAQQIFHFQLVAKGKNRWKMEVDKMMTKCRHAGLWRKWEEENTNKVKLCNIWKRKKVLFCTFCGFFWKHKIYQYK